MKFKAGTYYIGDPCYAIPDEQWDSWCTSMDKFEDYHGDVEMVNGGFGFEHEGEQVWCANTEWGDGTWPDQYGNEYSVDAGIIGVVPEALIDVNPNSPAVDPVVVNGGHVVRIDHEFEVDRNGGIITIGPYIIDTDPQDEEDEDVW